MRSPNHHIISLNATEGGPENHATSAESVPEATVQQTWPSCYTQHPMVWVSGRQAGSSSESSSQNSQERRREGQWR